MQTRPHYLESCFKKKGTKVGFWHKRYCKLTNHELLIYKTDMPIIVKYTLEITPQTEIELVEDQKILQFSLTLPGKPPIFLAHDDTDTLLTWVAQIRNMIRKIPDISMDHFNILSVIGRGFYGKVMLCQNKETHELVAIKTIHKNKLIRANKVKTIFTERNVLFRVHHPFIVAIRFSFQTETKLYLGLEFASGGELFTHAKNDGPLSIPEVRFYTAEISIALAYLHHRGIIYRDLKPENILLDEEGHIKLTDFGLAKNIDNNTINYTICGTSEYLSPEALNHKQYGPSVDWWALGILMYELLFGKTPFVDENRSKLYDNIRTAPLQFPDNADPAAQDIISHLLNKEPKNRAGLKEIKEHPFFNGLDFDAVERKEIKPIWVPPRTNELSLNNFGAQFTEEQPVDSFATPIRRGKDAFTGFSFCEGNSLLEENNINISDENNNNNDNNNNK